MTAYRILPELILRTPLLSYAYYHGVIDDTILNNPVFQASIYFASPSFYRTLAAKDFSFDLLNKKEMLSLHKYFNRMCHRPTPFGLFSTFSLVSWGTGNAIILGGQADLKIHLRADQGLAVMAGQLLEAEATAEYILNPTLYRLGNEFRFIKSLESEKSTKLKFIIESVEINPLTKRLVAHLQKNKISQAQITEFLSDTTGCGESEASDYFHFLKEVQMIRPSGGPNITGPDYYERINRSRPFSFPIVPEYISAGYNQVNTPSDLPYSSIINFEKAVQNKLTANGRKPPERLLYVNTERPLYTGALDTSYQEPILAAVKALTSLTEPAINPILDKFSKDFKSRFDERPIPLLQALDPEGGVGYGSLAEITTLSPLLNNIQFKRPTKLNQEKEWPPVRQLLFQKWNKLTEKDSAISLNASDLALLPKAHPCRIPASMPVMFRIANEKLIIESAGGVTGSSLIGRFTPFSKGIEQLNKDVAAREISANPDVIFADILQLSDSHADNINRRISPYDYEIPINCTSLLPEERQIKLADLVVSVKNDEVILECTRLKKRIIPRLSTAYNYRHNQLSLFQFLCDLQYQSLHFQLNADLETFFPGLPYYPRLEFEGTILALAKWHLSNAEIREIKNSPDDTSHLEKLWHKLKLPGLIAITNADQQLVFNLDDHNQKKLFSDVLVTLDEATLQEYLLPGKGSLSVSGDNQPLVNQFIAILYNSDKLYRPLQGRLRLRKKIDREFILGSTWLYLKIYCAPQAADDILTKVILPVIRSLKEIPLISWFFVRYADPENHIRLRIKIDEKQAGKVIAIFKNKLSGLVRNALVRDYMADTYRRELERYGTDMIGLAEDFFAVSSQLVVHYIKNNRRARTNAPDQFFNLGTMAAIVDGLVPDPGEQIEFLKSTFNAFSDEFHVEKKKRLELDKVYRTLRPAFVQLSKTEAYYKSLGISLHAMVFNRQIEKLGRQLYKFSKERKFQLTADFIHMHLNRVFSERQRQQETVAYYCLYKYKVSARSRSGINQLPIPLALNEQFLHSR